MKYNMSKLGDIGKVLMCKRVMKYQTSGSGDIPFFKISTFGGKADTYISKELYDEFRSKYSFPKNGDILISAAGTVGKTVIYKGEPAYFQDSNIVWIDNDESKILNVYLYYFYQTKPWLTTNGSTIKRIYNDNLRSIVIKYPDLLTQKAIAKVLSDLDAKIELNNKINQELEAMAKTLYDYWFVQFDFPNEQGKPYKSSGGKMVYNEELKREIPEGWEVGTFGDYAKVKSGFAFKSTWWTDEGIPVLKIKDIQEDYTLNQEDFSFVREDKIEVAKNFKSQAGDVVIAMTGATIGKFAIIPYTNKPILINQRVGLYNLGNKPFNKLPFLVNSMKQDFFRLKVFQMAGGAAQPNISGVQLDAFPVIFPNNKLVEIYNEKLKNNYKRIANNIKQNQQLTALRDWLLPMLMNGQVTVGEAALQQAQDTELSMAAEPKAKYKNNNL